MKVQENFILLAESTKLCVLRLENDQLSVVFGPKLTKTKNQLQSSAFQKNFKIPGEEEGLHEDELGETHFRE